MKKKLIFMAHNLDIGGIETALVSLLNNLDYNKYDVTLLLEEKTGVFLNELPSNVIIQEYILSNNSNPIIRKICNRFKLIFTIVKNYHKYDFAASYATYIKPFSILARYFSKNNTIWIHTDYYYYFNKNSDEMRKYFNDMNILKFKNIIFVANEALKHFKEEYPNVKNNVLVCNNIVNYKEIFKKSKIKLDVPSSNLPVLINISRHEERSKKLTKLIEACRLLNDADIKFELWLVGDGPDSNMYKNLVSKYKLSNMIKFIGMQSNPYPFLIKADALIMTSDYEGFPVSYIEALIFKKPILTTVNVSDDYLKITDKNGIIMNKTIDDIKDCIIKYLNEQRKFDIDFDVKIWNENAKKKLENIIEGDSYD